MLPCVVLVLLVVAGCGYIASTSRPQEHLSERGSPSTCVLPLFACSVRLEHGGLAATGATWSLLRMVADGSVLEPWVSCLQISLDASTVMGKSMIFGLMALPDNQAVVYPPQVAWCSTIFVPHSTSMFSA